MRKLFLANLAALTMSMAGPALAADMPIKAPAPFAERFSWTGCYVGGHIGGGFAHKDITDPVRSWGREQRLESRR
jgi:outer membrane immunogenic protein